MKAQKYVQMKDEDVVELQKAHKTACCDCGLVHLWELQPMKKGKFYFKISRDNRATAQLRRHKKYPKKG